GAPAGRLRPAGTGARDGRPLGGQLRDHARRRGAVQDHPRRQGGGMTPRSAPTRRVWLLLGGALVALAAGAAAVGVVVMLLLAVDHRPGWWQLHRAAHSALVLGAVALLGRRAPRARALALGWAGPPGGRLPDPRHRRLAAPLAALRARLRVAGLVLGARAPRG